MVKQDDIRAVFLTAGQMETCRKHAELCSIGGMSNIHSDGKDRQEKLTEDQLVGQVCTCAGTMWLGGSYEKGFGYYDMIRNRQNKTPLDGDGGDDLPPYRIDIKGSLVRNDTKDPLSYNLLVRPRERHDGFVYVMALYFRPSVVALVGWVEDSQLPAQVEPAGIFQGAFRMTGAELRPMDELRPAVQSRK
jgi:hypothetical protein